MRKLCAAFIITLSAVAAAAFVQPSTAHAVELRSCGQYAVIKCGVSSPQDFINKIKGPNKADLRNLYSEFGLKQQDYQRFANEAQLGYVYQQDDRIMTNGKVIAHSYWSVSPKKTQKFNYPRTFGGSTYYLGKFSQTQNAERTPAYILFDIYGKAQFVVLQRTGTPQFMYPIVPAYSVCTSISATPVAGQPNTYDITSTRSIGASSEFVDVNYHFGNGSRIQSQDPNVVVRRTFTGNGYVEVHVGARTPDGKVRSYPPDARCKLRIPYQAPATPTTPATPEQTPATPPTPTAPAEPTTPTTPVATPNTANGGACSQLTANLVDRDRRTYRFEAIAAPVEGWQVASVSMDFGDGVVVNGAKAADSKYVLTHDYTKAGSYTARATMHFEREGAKSSADCQTTVGVEDAAAVSPGEQPTELVSVGTGTQVFAVAGSLATVAGGVRYAIRRRLGV